jgi:hypothetical protein
MSWRQLALMSPLYLLSQNQTAMTSLRHDSNHDLESPTTFTTHEAALTRNVTYPRRQSYTLPRG